MDVGLALSAGDSNRPIRPESVLDPTAESQHSLVDENMALA